MSSTPEVYIDKIPTGYRVQFMAVEVADIPDSNDAILEAARRITENPDFYCIAVEPLDLEEDKEEADPETE